MKCHFIEKTSKKNCILSSVSTVILDKIQLVTLYIDVLSTLHMYIVHIMRSNIRVVINLKEY